MSCKNNLLGKEKYTVVNISRVGIENSIGFCCENCGKTLANHATIKDTKNKTYIVGLDCLKKLTNDISNQLEYSYYMLPRFNDSMKFLKILNDGISWHYINETIYVIRKTDRGTYSWFDKDMQDCAISLGFEKLFDKSKQTDTVVIDYEKERLERKKELLAKYNITL